MTNLSQSQLQRRVEILVTNGQLAPAQSVMAGVGYHPAALAEGAAMLQNWQTNQQQVQAQLAAQKRATQAVKEAHLAARTAVNDFSQTVRVLFGRDEATLTTLGLAPRRNGTNHAQPTEAATTRDANGQTNGHSQHNHTAIGVAEMVARWRLLLVNAQVLSQEQKARLAQAGWDAARLATAAALVEAYAAADTQHHQQTQAHRAERLAAANARISLSQWYSEASRLTKLAIHRSDPADQARLEELLGL